MATALSVLQQHLLNDFQRDLPLTPTPYREIADALGVDEEAVLSHLQSLQTGGVISRVGPVFAPNRLGASTLAAVAVPPERLEEVAALVNTFTEVNHNYEREHRYNLWFVLTARDEARLSEVLAQIEAATGLPVLSLPLLEEFHIDLGFPLRWED
ncbi:Lrp/AsnC family transcriptional regulator [Methylolobus aquaticus]|nr:Lrp/AsnC family transcriptional regulator [Methylolobus aquaticus]